MQQVDDQIQNSRSSSEKIPRNTRSFMRTGKSGVQIRVGVNANQLYCNRIMFVAGWNIVLAEFKIKKFLEKYSFLLSLTP